MFPEDFKIVEASFKVVDKAVGDAIETGDGLDFPSRTDRVTSVLSAASATPQYKSKASTTIALLPEAVVLGANSTSAVAARAVVLEAVYVSPTPKTPAICCRCLDTSSACQCTMRVIC